MSSLPQVSVVVPVLDGESTLGSCLHSLLAQDYPADRHELIFVDNGSTDRTPEILAEAGVRVLTEPRRSPSRAHGRRLCGKRQLDARDRGELLRPRSGRRRR